MSDGGTSGPATVRVLTFPLRLRCTGMSELLAAGGLEDAVARALGRAFDRARQTLPASVVVLQPPELVRGELAPEQQATLLGRLSRAIEQAARAQSLPLAPAAAPAPAGTGPRHHPAGQAVAAETWRIRIKVEFRLTPRQFFEIRRKYVAHRDDGSPDPLELYFPLLDQPMPATAWVTEVPAEREFTAHSREVLSRFAATRRPDEYVWSVHGWGALRAMVAEADHKVATRIPEFGRRGFVEDRPGPAQGERQTILRPGAWTLSVFLALPNIVLDDLVERGRVQTVDVPLREAAGLGSSADFAAEAGLDLPAAVREVPDVPVTVVVTPFTVRRRIHERTLAALFERYRREQFGGGRLGAVVPFTQSAIAGLGPTLGPFLATLATPAPAPTGGFWLPGSAGANLTPLVADVRKQALRTANAAFISSEAAEVERILRTENGFWSADRDDALRGFLTRWTTKVGDPALFGLLLDELDRRGGLDAFVRAIRALPSLNTYLKREVVALADGDPRIAMVAEDIEALVRDLGKSHYDVDAQEIWIDRDPGRKLRAAGGSSDDTAGVVAVVDPYYAESSRILQPKQEILDRLREPTRKKVAELVGRMVCRPGERMTREELLRKATQEAAKELPPLEEKDLVKVTLLKSVRVLRLERRRERGVDEIYVHYQPVQKVGDNPWMPAGDVLVQAPAGFEAYLTSYHVQHMESALTVFLMAEAVVLGGVMIVELGVATIGQLFFFVSMQVVVYHFTTDAEDRTLEGYLGAALKGELDAVGFKILSGAVKQLGGFVAGQLVTRELVGQVATKWIVYGLRGVATATGVGGLEVTYQLGEDLLHYSHCNGWSDPGKYWDRFTTGFAMTLAFEFLAVPILAPPMRLALEKASTAREAARALRASGKSLREIAELLLKGADEVEAAIGRTVQHEAGPAIVRGFRQKVGDVLKALGREYESRAYQSLLDLYGPELSGEALGTLQRLLRAGGEHQVDALLQRALAGRRTPTELLGALGHAEESLLVDLARTGKLSEVATLDEVAVRMLQRLHGAKVRIGAFFDGSGPSLKTFADEFAKLPEARRAAALENAAGRTPAQVLDEARGPAEPKAPEAVAPPAETLDDILRRLAESGFTRSDVRAFMGDRTRLSAQLARRVARLLEKYGPEEVRAFGRYLAEHKVYLDDEIVTQLLENVPKGKLEAAIDDLEQLLAGDETPPPGLSEKDLAGLSVHETEPPRTRVGPDGVERPLRDVVETPGSRALRASLIARDGVPPPPGSHAHHIVPENDFRPGLDWLRDRLSDAGCGINEAGNGVFLAGSRSTANPELTRLHNSYIHAGETKEYAYTLTRRLDGLQGDALLEEIETIGGEMAEGKFKILEIPRGWKTRWEPGMTAPADPTVAPEWIE
ncbi:AHH domain-containing protein [Nonomuraea jiangxiensis]|uniref:A nuclease family of the HNH/ENDO VII superfamily with conserved AHH n=1 Tax=Nonomuraea jiangxiensis TaxID=633440 RepID=A0A1G9PT55_9ACTN|nr:AHH domain-containing protein [Nonomuraea jiangxiensis]SDM01823.1 A nuclease family of the HNH/ENDO VII superfamily with conserved AHH [Nonomuraea jiangxiensis]